MAPFEAIGEKRVPGEAAVVQWCPTMDLIALTTADNQLFLLRLSWQKVWSRPGRELETMTALAWRPDGKVLAVGHSDGSVALLDVEDGEELFCHSATGSAVRGLQWEHRTWPECDLGLAEDDVALDLETIPLFEEAPTRSALDEAHAAATAAEYVDRTAEVLPPLPPLADPTDLINRPEILIGPSETTHVLAVVTTDARITFHSLGIFCVGTGPLDPAPDPDGGGIAPGKVAIAIGADLSEAMVAVLPPSGELQTYAVRAPLLAAQPAEVHCIAVQWAHISGLLRYLDAVASLMKSAWESILIELDAKLAAFSESQKAAAGVDEPKLLEHEFMGLLARGIPSVDLEHFLVRELSPKLKALGTAVESSYGTIQRLSVTHFNAGLQALMFRLGDLGGLVEWTERFGSLGLEHGGLAAANGTLGALAHKSAELVRRIGSSRTSFKAFFAWLNKVVASLGGKSAAAEAGIGPIDFGQVSTFIQQNFAAGTDDDAVSVEHVGQYFEPAPLRTVPEHPQPRWRVLLSRLSLRLPEAGGHGEILAAVEVLQGGGAGAPVDGERVAEAIDMPVHEAEPALRWLVENGLLQEHGMEGYTVPGDAVARSKQPLLFPDRTRASLAQVLGSLVSEVTTIFGGPTTVGGGAVAVRRGLPITPTADQHPGLAVLRAARPDVAAAFCVVYADASNAGDGSTVVFCEASPDGDAVSVAAATFDAGAVLQLRPYSDGSVVALAHSAPEGEPGASGTFLSVLPGASLEYTPVAAGPNTVAEVANVVATATPTEELDEHRSRPMENIKAGSVHVSASRKLAAVFDAQGRGLELYDLDGDDDEEEEEEEDDEQEEGDEGSQEDEPDAEESGHSVETS